MCRVNKRVIVGFRGSQSPLTNRDWQTNFNARLVNLRTPKKIRDKMDGKVKDRVLVHEGFYSKFGWTWTFVLIGQNQRANISLFDSQRHIVFRISLRQPVHRW